MIKLLVQILIMPMPWPLRRRLLNLIPGYRIAKTARIRWSIILANCVILEQGARVGSLTLVKGLSELLIEQNSILGNLNWVSGSPLGSRFFHDQPERRPALIIRSNASVTHRHLIDCSDMVEIGSFTTVGGWGTQILTHSIDVTESRQRAHPVRIGRYAFIGTRCILLKGSRLPDYSILGAGSVLSHDYTDTFRLYSGVPAAPVRTLEADSAYFARTEVGVY